MARCIFHIDLDAFFVSVEQVLNPTLKGRPVVVGGNPQGRGVVASASYEARAYGIHSGMPLIYARRLCPSAIFLRGSFARYCQVSQQFMNILADFTPCLEPLGIDEAYLDMNGWAKDSTKETARRIKDRIRKELSLTASIGIASCKVVAKIASKLSKPDGLLEVPQGEESCFLSPLPMERLPGLGKRTKHVLQEMGIDSIGQLASLPLPLLRQSLGKVGETLQQYARGVDERKVESPAPAKSISREVTFSQDSSDKFLLQATLRYISEWLGRELRSQKKQIRTVTLKLRYADFQTITRSHTLKTASDMDQIIFDTSIELLELALAQRQRAVRLLGLRLSNLTSAYRQLPLLKSSMEGLEELNEAIDHIRRKYGFASIQTGRTLLLGDIFAPEQFLSKEFGSTSQR